LKIAIHVLRSERIIDQNLNYIDEICSDVNSIGMIYGPAAMFREEYFIKEQSTLGMCGFNTEYLLSQEDGFK
jgi:hypothetical protein